MSNARPAGRRRLPAHDPGRHGDRARARPHARARHPALRLRQGRGGDRARHLCGVPDARGRHYADLGPANPTRPSSPWWRPAASRSATSCCRTTTSSSSRSPRWSRRGGYWALKYTRYGRLLTVVIFDRETAAAFGINVTLVYTVTFVIGAMLGALGGAVMAPKISVTLGIGVEVIVLAFAVVVTGGLGSIEGALIGALIVGLCRAAAVHLVAADRAVRHLRGHGAGAGVPPLWVVHPGPAAENLTCGRARPFSERWLSSRLP